MPIAQKGISFYQTSWTGTCVITRVSDSSTTTVTPSDPVSPMRFSTEVRTAGVTLIDSSFNLTVSDTGIITFSCDEGFSLTFTGTAGTRMGFTSASYTGGTTYTANTDTAASFFPYSEDVFFYTNKIRKPMVEGVATGEGGVWHRTPGTDHENPTLSFAVLRSKSLEFIDAHAELGTVGKLDLIDESNVLTAFFCGGIRVSEQSEFSGFTDIEIEVAS